MRCVGKDNAVRERMQCGDFIQAPHWLFRADILHGPMQIYCNGCRRYLKRATQYYCCEICFTHANPANPAKDLEQNLRDPWDYLFGRCTQTSLLAHHSLLTAHRSRFCDNLSHRRHLRAIKKRKALSLQSKGDSLGNERRFNGKVKAMHQICQSDELWAVLFCPNKIKLVYLQLNV